jgi:hypothetical protein
MKYYLIILLFVFGLSSCSLNDDVNDTAIDPIEKVEWHLLLTTGGISGVNDQFNLQTVIWSFNEITSTLIVENNNDDDTKQDFLDSGTYTYNIVTENGLGYITINDSEVGRIFFKSLNQMVIDENQLPDGSGADGFIYNFTKVLVPAEQ